MGNILFGAVADDLGDLLVQLAHTTFTGVPVDDPLEHLIRQGDRMALHPVLLKLFGQQVALGDLNLFLERVTVHFDDLHPVQQCRLDGRKVVGRSDEQYPGEVVTRFEEVVVERIVLLGVEHFQHGR